MGDVGDRGGGGAGGLKAKGDRRRGWVGRDTRGFVLASAEVCELEQHSFACQQPAARGGGEQRGRTWGEERGGETREERKELKERRKKRTLDGEEAVGGLEVCVRDGVAVQVGEGGHLPHNTRV